MLRGRAMQWTLVNLSVAVLLTASLKATAATDATPTCQNPQLLGTGSTLGNSVSSNPGVVWNGTDYAVVYYQATSPGELRFQRIYADGTPATPPVVIASCNTSARVGLAWTGSSYGVTYMYYTGTYYQVNFVRLDANGTVLTPAFRVNQYGSAAAASAYYPTIATSGTTFAVAWQDLRGGNSDIYGTLLDANGNVMLHDLVLDLSQNDQSGPTIAWSRMGQRYWIVAQDTRSGTRSELSSSYLLESGYVYQYGVIVSGGSSSYSPMLADSGSVLGLTWYDYRDGNYEIYFAALSSSGPKVVPDLRVTNDPSSSFNPVVVWTGGEYGIFWQDYRNGFSQLWFQRIGSDGTLTGNNVRISLDYAYYLGAAFGQHGYLAGFGYNTGLNVVPWGCNYPYAPSCPEAPDAYSITGTTDTTAWLSAIDNYTDIAYYQVFRNDAQVGLTSKTFFNDSGLSANTQYQYNFRAVNAAGLVSAPCPNAQIYVRSSASLALSVGKSANDVNLFWTDGNGSNNYRVMRGTSPQAMVQINSTSALNAVDKNAAVGNVCYYYSVDVPQR